MWVAQSCVFRATRRTLANHPENGETSEEWLGEGAKAVVDPGAKVSQESFAPSEPCFAPAQPYFAPVQEAYRPLGRKHLLHPLLTTFSSFPIFGPSPRFFGLQGPTRSNPVKFVICSFCLLDIVKEFSRFGRKISAKIGKSRLKSARIG